MIKITERFQPFSLCPGTRFQIPGSDLFCRVYPSFIQILDRFGNSINNFCLEKDDDNFFCVMQDLHKIGVRIFSGKRRYWLSSLGELKDGKAISRQSCFSSEFLSLGANKKLDWEMIYRRKNLSEILPLWFRLGALTPRSKEPIENVTSENLTLFSSIINGFFHQDGDSRYRLLQQLFFSCFPFTMIPYYENIHMPKYEGMSIRKGFPLSLVSEGASFIRDLFIRCEGTSFYILPCLLKQFHSGRFIGISCDDLGTMDLSWSKKMIRKIIFKSLKDCVVKFVVSKDIRTFRLSSLADGEKSFLKADAFIEMKSHTTYIFDRFQK